MIWHRRTQIPAIWWKLLFRRPHQPPLVKCLQVLNLEAAGAGAAPPNSLSHRQHCDFRSGVRYIYSTLLCKSRIYVMSMLTAAGNVVTTIHMLMNSCMVSFASCLLDWIRYRQVYGRFSSRDDRGVCRRDMFFEFRAERRSTAFWYESIASSLRKWPVWPVGYWGYESLQWTSTGNWSDVMLSIIMEIKNTYISQQTFLVLCSSNHFISTGACQHCWYANRPENGDGSDPAENHKDRRIFGGITKEIL